MSLSLEGAVLALLASWLLAHLLGLLVWARGLSPELAPALRQRRLAWAAASVLLLPAGAVLLLSLASAMPSAEWVQAHCGGHSHDHLHACGDGTASADAIYRTLLLGITVLVVWRMAGALLRERRLRRHVDALHALSPGCSRLRRVDSEQPLALARGHDQPAVLVSRGLCQALSHRQLRMVVSHEVAHLRHGDARRSLLLGLLLSLWLPPLAGWLQQAWQQALEEAADDRVRQRFGGTELADTLLRVLSLNMQHLAGSQGITGHASARRIRRLLTPAPPVPSTDLVAWVYPAMLLGLAALALLAHHPMETLIHRFVGL